jgi:hypothetical protein
MLICLCRIWLKWSTIGTSISATHTGCNSCTNNLCFYNIIRLYYIWRLIIYLWNRVIIFRIICDDIFMPLTKSYIFISSNDSLRNIFNLWYITNSRWKGKDFNQKIFSHISFHLVRNTKNNSNLIMSNILMATAYVVSKRILDFSYLVF